MANEENLKPFNELTEKEQRKIASKGGKASVKARREKKTMKQMLDYLLEKEVQNPKGEKASTLEAISLSLIKQALSGNVKAYEVIRDTIGQKPVEKTLDLTPTNEEETKRMIDDIIKEARESEINDK